MRTVRRLCLVSLAGNIFEPQRLKSFKEITEFYVIAKHVVLKQSITRINRQYG